MTSLSPHPQLNRKREEVSRCCGYPEGKARIRISPRANMTTLASFRENVTPHILDEYVTAPCAATIIGSATTFTKGIRAQTNILYRTDVDKARGMTSAIFIARGIPS